MTRRHPRFCCVLMFTFPSAALAGEGWTPLFSGVVTPLHAVHFTDVNTGYAVGAGGIALRTLDGESWQLMPTGTGNDLHDVAFIGSVGVVVGARGTVLRTIDGGATWLPSAVAVTDDLRSVSLSGSGGVVGGASQTILYTIDGGVSWQISQTGFFGGGFFGAVMLSPDVAFVGGENSIFQPLAGSSGDGGQSWTFSVFYLDGNEGAISRIAFTDATVGHAASRVWNDTGAISSTSDGGQSWSTTLFPDALFGIEFPTSDAGQIGYAVGANGTILKTRNAGTLWYALESGSVSTLRDVSFVDADTGYAVGEGGVVLKTTTGGETTTHAGEVTVTSARSAGLAVRAVPNPFASRTVLDVDLGDGEPGTIHIFDATGRRVRSLTPTGPAPGTGIATWNGTNDSGHHVPPGVYYVRIEAGDRDGTGALVRIR